MRLFRLLLARLFLKLALISLRLNALRYVTKGLTLISLKVFPGNPNDGKQPQKSPVPTGAAVPSVGRRKR